MTVYKLEVEGLTCAHCVASVSEELSEIPAVSAVEVELNAGKETISVATVTASDEVSEADFIAAIDEAGYKLVSVNA